MTYRHLYLSPDDSAFRFTSGGDEDLFVEFRPYSVLVWPAGYNLVQFFLTVATPDGALHVHEETNGDSIVALHANLKRFLDHATETVGWSSSTSEWFFCRSGDAAVVSLVAGSPWCGYAEHPERLWEAHRGAGSGCQFKLAFRATLESLRQTVREMDFICAAIERMCADESLDSSGKCLSDYAAACNRAQPGAVAVRDQTVLTPAARVIEIEESCRDKKPRTGLRFGIEPSAPETFHLEVQVHGKAEQHYRVADHLTFEKEKLIAFVGRLHRMANGERDCPRLCTENHRLELAVLPMPSELALLRCGLGKWESCTSQLALIATNPPIRPRQFFDEPQQTLAAPVSHAIYFESAMFVEIRQLLLLAAAVEAAIEDDEAMN